MLYVASCWHGCKNFYGTLGIWKSTVSINYNNNETLLIFNTIILLYLTAPDNHVYIYSRFISTYCLCFPVSSVLEYVTRVFCSC